MTIGLPALEAQTRATVAEPLAGDGDAAHEARVLLVDDDEQIRRPVSRLLRAAGHRVLSAASCSEAMAIIQASERIDVLLTETILSDMLGAEIARRALAVDPAIRVVHRSGLELTGSSRNAGDGLVARPFAPEQPRDTIAAALARPA